MVSSNTLISIGQCLFFELLRDCGEGNCKAYEILNNSPRAVYKNACDVENCLDRKIYEGRFGGSENA